jgi:nucleotide-binding universal stress UspA family protein
MAEGRERPVMLALSTFRRSEAAVTAALDRARTEARPLCLVYVVDMNLARYFIGTDLGLNPHLHDRCEDELLEEHRAEAERDVVRIAGLAADQGVVGVTSHVEVGRFALVVLEHARLRSPVVIYTTRSDRPDWVRRFFGSPVDTVIERAGVPVVELQQQEPAPLRSR